MRAALTGLGGALGAVAVALATLAYHYGTQAAQAQAQLAQQGRAAVAVVNRCSPVYQLSWIGRECSGAARLLPAAVKAIACKQSVKHYRKHSLEAVRRRAEQLGPGTPGVVLLIERGDKEERLPLTWRVKR